MDFVEVIENLNLEPPVQETRYLQITLLISQRKWSELRELFKILRLSGEKGWSEGYALLDNLIECRDDTLLEIVVWLFFSLRPVVETINALPIMSLVLFYGILIKNRVLIDKLLTFAGVSINGLLNGQSPLCFAIRSKAGVDIVRFIIDLGACVNEMGLLVERSPLGILISWPPSDLDVAELLLSYGADVNRIYSESVTKTLVNLACETSNNEGLKWLLSHKADPNEQTKCGTTGLHTAVTLGDLSNVTTLLEFGASINALDRIGKTPLIVAVERNYVEIAELLLQRGAEFCNTTMSVAFTINIKTNHSKPNYRSDQYKMHQILKEHGFLLSVCINDNEFIHTAAMHGDVFTVKAFLEAGGSPNIAFDNAPLLSAAVISESKDLVEILLAHEPDRTLKYGSRSALVRSVGCNLVEITELLLSKGHTCLSMVCLFIAADNLNIEMLKVLLKYGETNNVNEVDSRSWTILHYAIWSKHSVSRFSEDIDLEKAEVVRFLVNHGASVSSHLDFGLNKHPMLVAVQCDYVEVVKVLLEAVGSFDYFVVDEPNSLPITILHLAISCNSEKMVKFLLEKGASVDALRFDGKTPLEIAVESNASKAVRVLLESGANVRNTFACNQNLLFMSIDRRSPAEIVDDLLKFGADVDDRRNGGETALHKACLLGNGDVIAVLLDHGADINAEDSMKITPFMLFTKSLLAMQIVAQGNWYAYEHGEAIAGPITPVYHLQRHAFKMNFLGLPLHPCYNSALELKYCNYFISSCKEELEAMKTFKIGSNHLNLYDVIKQQQDPVYVCNSSVMLNLDGNDQWENFTLYRGIFKRCIKIAKLRNKLLDSGQKRLSDMFRFSCLNNLPEEVLRKIVSYFNDEELQILQTA